MKYYTCANTSGGLVDFTEENIFDINTKIELKCTNNNISDYILSQICTDSAESIIEVGYSDLKSGIVIRDKDIAIIKNCKSPTRIIYFDDYFGEPVQSAETKQLYQGMLSAYSDAKAIHDEWESIYIKNMDFDRLNKFGDDVIQGILKDKIGNGVGKTYKRFFGTTTADGPTNHIDDITKGLNKRYFIKGRPGTGKSTFLKKLSKELRDRSFDAEEYYCSFDKSSLDMVVSRELAICVFDSTAPHEKFPSGETDEILDFYINSGLEGIDEEYKKELYEIEEQYNRKIYEGKKNLIAYLKENKKCHDLTDIHRLNEICDKIVRDIKEII